MILTSSLLFVQGANGCGPDGNCNLFDDPFHAMFTECCNIVGDEEN